MANYAVHILAISPVLSFRDVPNKFLTPLISPEIIVVSFHLFGH